MSRRGVSSALPRSAARRLLRVLGYVWCGLGFVSLGPTVVLTLRTATGDVPEMLAALGTDPVATRLAAVAVTVAGLIVGLVLVSVGTVLLGLGRVVELSERSDGWLRSVARDSAPPVGFGARADLVAASALQSTSEPLEPIVAPTPQSPTPTPRSQQPPAPPLP